MSGLQKHQFPSSGASPMIALNQHVRVPDMTTEIAVAYPGRQHHPEAKGGPVIALFILPSGRISHHAAPQE
jgi:hypothetical protein